MVVGRHGVTPPVVVPRPVADRPVPPPPRMVGIAPAERGITPPERRVVPAEVPAAVVGRGPPRTEHGGDVLGLDPYLVAADHDVVECRVVCRGEHEGAGILVAQRVVARRHAVFRRAETPHAAGISAFVAVGHDVGGVVVVLLLGGPGARFGHAGLPFGLGRLGPCPAAFGLRLFALRDRGAVVCGVEVVVGAAGRGVTRRRTSCGAGGEQQRACEYVRCFHRTDDL